MKDNNGKLIDESEEIKRHLQIDRTKELITNELLDSLKKSNALFSNKGPCGSIQIVPYPDGYFVAQEFNDNKDDLRRSIDDALNKLGYSSVVASDFYLSEKLICKIAALIQGTPFGVYQLTTSQNRNVYLELGIALGLGKSFVLVKDKSANPVRIVQDIEYYEINDYLDVRYRLGNLLEKYMTSVGRSQINQTYPDGSSNEVVIYHGDAESVDITVVVAREIKNMGFTPIILGKYQENLARYLQSEANVEPKFVESRDRILEAIQTTKYGVFRIHKSASPDNFVAMGISIGLNKPFLPLKHRGEDVPSDLSYLSAFEYSGFTDLERRLKMQLPDWLMEIEN
jgi:hypothetical protein